MEIETMMRYKLPVIIVIVNNNGIYSGFSQEVMDDIQAGGDIAQWYVSLNRTTLCGMPPPFSELHHAVWGGPKVPHSIRPTTL